MKINWKDFGLMYVIAYVLNHILVLTQRFLFPEAITSELHFSYFLFTGLLFAIPLGFYFWRNKSTLQEVIINSSILSFTYPWILLQLIPLFFIGALQPSIFETYSLNFYIPAILDVVTGIVSGLIVWLVITNYIQSKSK